MRSRRPAWSPLSRPWRRATRKAMRIPALRHIVLAAVLLYLGVMFMATPARRLLATGNVLLVLSSFESPPPPPFPPLHPPPPPFKLQQHIKEAYVNLTLTWADSSTPELLRHAVDRLLASHCHGTNRTNSQLRPSPLLHSTDVVLDARRHLLVFTHIPKCAGTATFNALQSTADECTEARFTPWFPPRSCERSYTLNRTQPDGILVQQSAKCTVVNPYDVDSFLHPGCAASSNGVGAHCSHSELASCIAARHAKLEWPGVHASSPPSSLPLVGSTHVAGVTDQWTPPSRGAPAPLSDATCGSRRNVCAELPRQLGARMPLFIGVLREPTQRTLSEFRWGLTTWCKLELIGAQASAATMDWNPWPPSLCDTADDELERRGRRRCGGSCAAHVGSRARQSGDQPAGNAPGSPSARAVPRTAASLPVLSQSPHRCMGLSS